MLQLFEGYLDRKDVADEARYDKVREGAIICLGTLARHLDPSDAKVLFTLLPSSLVSLHLPSGPLVFALCSEPMCRSLILLLLVTYRQVSPMLQ